MKKLVQALMITGIIFSGVLTTISPASANNTTAIGTTFDEAAMYSPITSRHFGATPAITVDADVNIYTASVAEQNQAMVHVRNMGVNDSLAGGRGSHSGNNLIVTKVNKDGEVQ